VLRSWDTGQGSGARNALKCSPQITQCPNCVTPRSISPWRQSGRDSVSAWPNETSCHSHHRQWQGRNLPQDFRRLHAAQGGEHPHGRHQPLVGLRQEQLEQMATNDGHSANSEAEGGAKCGVMGNARPIDAPSPALALMLRAFQEAGPDERVRLAELWGLRAGGGAAAALGVPR
jgi:hypothetical protein